eukprot:scaffold13927_cov32-Tisochrysis_lutea.AAC.2
MVRTLVIAANGMLDVWLHNADVQLVDGIHLWDPPIHRSIDREKDGCANLTVPSAINNSRNGSVLFVVWVAGMLEEVLHRCKSRHSCIVSSVLPSPSGTSRGLPRFGLPATTSACSYQRPSSLARAARLPPSFLFSPWGRLGIAAAASLMASTKDKQAPSRERSRAPAARTASRTTSPVRSKAPPKYSETNKSNESPASRCTSTMEHSLRSRMKFRSSQPSTNSSTTEANEPDCRRLRKGQGMTGVEVERT